MRNKYGGLCYQCGKWVEPGKGYFERNAGGWRVHHVSCTLVKRDAVPAHIAKKIEERVPKSFLVSKE